MESDRPEIDVERALLFIDEVGEIPQAVIDHMLWGNPPAFLRHDDGSVEPVPHAEFYGIDMARGVDGAFYQVIADDGVVQILDAFHIPRPAEIQIPPYVDRIVAHAGLISKGRNRHERRAIAKGAK